MTKRRPGARADLEEVRPRRFVIHNGAVGPALRGEGLREGDRFTLTSQRGAGVVARVRGRGFTVLTLADQIAKLPPLPSVAPLGAALLHPLQKHERISHLSGSPPAWQPAPVSTEQPQSVRLYVNAIIRRRKGRGPSSYALVTTTGFQALDEDAALLRGYALAAQADPSAVAVATLHNGDYLLPDLLLPSAQRTLMGRIATKHETGWQFAPADLPLVQALLECLGCSGVEV
ncbi:hypothetical protein [Candidatus Viridilinea mediisalina]|uniref:Uncharacterized protein n=1 Tax=Candidatus Viridilinea mediisalina TaxID=2024553 RepID=A0A2A6RIV4_9CHLR|nr:hypothetical protein [Candidatus Viridilinea mediisalina]PDW02819.1 hypothetical protein CJ255_12120 [Candidatus Viridilinea mediisalina]